MEDSEDLFSKLLKRNLLDTCAQIVLYLDSKSYANFRLVSKNWKNYADHVFTEETAGKKYLTQKLHRNLFDQKYVPKKHAIHFDCKIFEFIADQLGIVVSTHDGTLSSHEFRTLYTKWSRKICKNGLRLCMTQTRIFASTEYPCHENDSRSIKPSDLYVISRECGHVLRKVAKYQLRPCYGIEIFDERYRSKHV